MSGARFVQIALLANLARHWLQSKYVKNLFESKCKCFRGKIYPLDPKWKPHFNAAEVDAFEEYIIDSAINAPTHSAVKTMGQLIPQLGAEHGGLVPNIEIEVLAPAFPLDSCIRINARRKLGCAVMKQMVELLAEAMRDPRRGCYTAVVDEAGHFGYGGLWARKLADLGLVVRLENTAGRGSEVIPYGGTKPTMGTNPVTWALPTKEYLGFHIVGDYSTSPMSIGTLSQQKRLGRKLPEGPITDAHGRMTSDPKEARFIRHESHHTSADGLFIEALAAMGGGGIPSMRAIASEDGMNPGGASNWLVSVWKPHYFQVKAGIDPIAQVVSNLKSIVHDNADARLPGARYPDNARRAQDYGDAVLMEEAELTALSTLFTQAELSFDQNSLPAI